jgi:D-ornithine/D-lysine decarboxylase
MEKLISYSQDVHRVTGCQLRDLNIGGGIPIRYVKGGRYGDALPKEVGYLGVGFGPQAIAAEIADLLGDDPLGAKNGREMSAGTRLILEPGRSIVGDAGILLSRVQNYKVRPGSGDRWLMLDAGFHTLLGSFSYKWYFHPLGANRIDEPHEVGYKLAGPLCDSGDVFGNVGGLPGDAWLPAYRLLPSAMQADDVVAFLDSGAYTLEQMFPYNGHPCAQAVMINTQGGVLPIRRRSTYFDLIGNDGGF